MLKRYGLIWALGATALASCSSCRKPSVKPNVHEAVAPEVTPPSLPEAPQWEAASMADYAVPTGCKLQEAPRRYRQKGEAKVIFLSTPGDTGSLAVAFFGATGTDTTSARGVWDLGPQAGATQDIPWLKASSPPLFGSVNGRWVAVLQQTDALTPNAALWIWRNGKPLSLLAQGDRLVGYDARCDKGRCVIATSRAGTVAIKGASLWNFDIEDTKYARLDVSLDTLEAEIHQLSIASYDGESQTSVFAASDGRQVLLGKAGPKGTTELGRVAAESGWIDASAQGTKAIVVGTRGTREADGCTPAGSSLVIGRTGAAEIVIPTTQLAVSGYARALGKGFVVTWVAPVNCRQPKRKAVWAQLLSEDAEAIGEPMGIGDADGHAVSTRGNELQMFLRNDDGITWIRARCDKP